MDEKYTLERANRLVSDWISTQPDEVKAQQAAVEYYGKYFAPENINAVARDGFKDFLLLKNNRHWDGIHRHPNIYADMKRLKQCLKLLLDESRPIEERLDRILPPKRGPIHQRAQPRRIKGGAIIDHMPPRERRLVAVEK